LAIDQHNRLFFFDGSYNLRMLTYNSIKSEDICQGELWGKAPFIKTTASS